VGQYKVRGGHRVAGLGLVLSVEFECLLVHDNSPAALRLRGSGWVRVYYRASLSALRDYFSRP
jgi:hypothetical protein